MFRSLPPLRRILAITTVSGLAIVGLSACSSSKSDDTAAETAVATEAPDTVAADSAPPSSDASGSDTAAATEAVAATTSGALKGKKVVYLINGALGDKGFYDSGQAGMDALKETYGAETRTLEANFDAAKYQALVDAAFEEGDVIFAIAYGFEDALKAAAKANPDKPVVNLDFDINDPDKHVTSVDFIEEQSAYLAGVAAAMMTTETSIKGVNADLTVGVVGGDTDPVTSSFLFAYENGAKSINPEITVERKSLGGAWDDQAKGKQAAEQLYDAGADVVFQVAAAAGLGVLQAAKERGAFAIGVDANQNDLQPGHVIASDIKDMGGTIEKIAATVDNGTYKPGVVLQYGIAEGGVDLVTETKTPVMTDAMVLKIREYREQIVNGSLKVALYKP